MPPSVTQRGVATASGGRGAARLTLVLSARTELYVIA
jgi:hypothetical protein